MHERIEQARPRWIPATVLLREISERGYEGGIGQLKAWLAPLKKTEPEAVVRFDTPPGQQRSHDPRSCDATPMIATILCEPLDCRRAIVGTAMMMYLARRLVSLEAFAATRIFLVDLPVKAQRPNVRVDQVWKFQAALHRTQVLCPPVGVPTLGSQPPRRQIDKDP